MLKQNVINSMNEPEKPLRKLPVRIAEPGEFDKGPDLNIGIEETLREQDKKDLLNALRQGFPLSEKLQAEAERFAREEEERKKEQQG
jgi:hypothetical protein